MIDNTLNNQRVIFQPKVCKRIQEGINKIINAIKPTLGPMSRLVAIDRILDSRMPELVNNGGTIAMKIIQLQDPDEDVGAMLVRDFLLNLQDQIGDGTSTGAVLLQSIYNESLKYVFSGGNPTRLQFYLKKGMNVILDNLFNMVIPLEGGKKLAQVAKTLCGNDNLAKYLGEIFDIIGEYGRLEIRSGYKRNTDREYIEGMYWERGVISREMIRNKKSSKVVLNEPAILISDIEIRNPKDLFPVISLALKSKFRSLLIIADEISDSVVGLILANNNPKKLKIIAVKTPGWDEAEKAEFLEDISILTGGKPYIKVAGDNLNKIKAEDFGWAKQAWADRYNFGIIGGKGDPRKIRQHIIKLREVYKTTADPIMYERLQTRIGKMMGGTAVLWVGGSTELEVELTKQVAKKTSTIMREAIKSGIIPGGGIALLDCQPVIEKMLKKASDPDERIAYRILLKALEEPVRTIIRNAGYDDDKVIYEIKKAGMGYGFDAFSGNVVNMIEAGIWDVASVIQSAFYGAVTTAIMALSVDVIVHRNNKDQIVIPRTPGLKKRFKPRHKLG